MRLLFATCAMLAWSSMSVLIEAKNNKSNKNKNKKWANGNKSQSKWTWEEESDSAEGGNGNGNKNKQKNKWKWEVESDSADGGSTRSDCTECTDLRSPWMISHDKYCDTWDQTMYRCNQESNPWANYWSKMKFCQKTCFQRGFGYDGDNCCHLDEGAPVVDEATSCTPCTNYETSWMARTGKTCDTWHLKHKCTNDQTGWWQKERFCSKRCFEIDLAYEGDNCCPDALDGSSASSGPEIVPSTQITSEPSSVPTKYPTSRPSKNPTEKPTEAPSPAPSRKPSARPSLRPSRNPSAQPSRYPTAKPSSHPITEPTPGPSSAPAAMPSLAPSWERSTKPSARPSLRPSFDPSAQPSHYPTAKPSFRPSAAPTSGPSSAPSPSPSDEPSAQSFRPSAHPSTQPSAAPTPGPALSESPIGGNSGSCIHCSNEPSPYMIGANKTCEDWRLTAQKCNTTFWVNKQFCAKTCADADLGYEGLTNCCADDDAETTADTSSNCVKCIDIPSSWMLGKSLSCKDWKGLKNKCGPNGQTQSFVDNKFCAQSCWERYEIAYLDEDGNEEVCC